MAFRITSSLKRELQLLAEREEKRSEEDGQAIGKLAFQLASSRTFH
jgi:hypothetical protein